MKTPLRVLIVEDSESDAELVIRQLKKAEYSVHHERVETAKDMRAALEKQTWDVVISGYKLPRFSAPAALALLQKINLDIPFIVVSGSIDEETAVELMRAGANDYLMKDKLERLAPIVKRELAEAQIRRKRKQSEEALGDREARLSLIYDNVNDVIYTIAVESNIHFRFTSVNCRFLEVTGLSEDQVVGKLIQDVIPKPALAIVLEKYREAIHTRQSVHWEEISKYPKGEKIGEVTVAPIFSTNGICTQLIGTVHDITERKQTEEALRRAEEQYRTIFENAIEGIYQSTPEGKFLAVNPAMARILGYTSPEELIRKRIDIAQQGYVDPHDRKEFKHRIETSGVVNNFEYEALRKDGSGVWVSENARLIRDARGRVIYYEGSLEDITDRKQSEIALRASEERFRKLVEGAPAAVIILSSKGEIRYVNSMSLKLFGYHEVDDHLGLKMLDNIAPESRDLVIERYRLRVQGVPIPDQFEIMGLRTDGTRFPVHISVSHIRLGDEDVTLNFITDITERKRAEEALRESETKYRDMVEQINDVIYATDINGRVTYISPSVEILGGYKQDEMIGHLLTEFIDPVFLPKIKEQYIKVLAGNLEPSEYRVKNKAGEYKWVRSSSKPILEKGQPVGMRGLLTDISARKQAEESVNLLNHTVKSIIECISVTDLNNTILFVNKAFLDTYGYTEEEVLGKNINDIAHTKGADKQKILTTTTLCGEWHGELINRKKDGTEFPIYLSTSVVLDELGKAVALVGVATDITERKQAEEVIRESEERFRMVFENVFDGISIYDENPDPFKRRLIECNERYAAMAGRTREELLKLGNTKTLQLTLEDSANNARVEALSAMTVYRGSFSWIRPDGKDNIIEYVGVPVIWRGKSYSIGIDRDISERKRAEETLRESEQKFRLVFENVFDGLSIFEEAGDPDQRRLIECNERYAQMAGRSREELLRFGTTQVIAKSLSEDNRYSIERGTVFAGIFSWIRPDGKDNIIEYTAVPMKIKGKRYTIGIDRDITERKRAEEALRKSEETLSRITNSIEDVIYSVDGQTQEFTYLSPAFEKLLGYTIADVHQMGGRRAFLSKVIEGGQFAQQDAEFENLLSNVKPKAPIWETWWRCKDGSLVCLEDRSIPTYDGERLLSTEGVLRDISKRKEVEDELKESEERYRRLVEFSPETILVHSEGKIVYVNPAAVTLLGANNISDLIDKPFLDIIHPDYRDSVHQQIIAVLKEEYALPLTEQKFIRLDGSIVEVEVTALPIVYREKSAMQLVVRDISEQKKLQNQLIQTQKIQSIGTLAGGIAHDFNNILGIILAYSSLLDKNNLTPEKFSMSITAINQAVQRGAALVRQILTFARKTDIIFEPMDISELIRELLSMLAQTFPKTITFSESIANSLPLIFADRTQVHQALLNLCINARDAMPNGGSISIAAEKQTREQMHQQFPAADEDAYVCLTVTDTGKGMDEATCLRVFDPFFTTKEKGKGTGLGLSVVYGVVQAHHGFIDLKSEPGRGTTFRLFFPVPTIKEQTVDTQQPIESFETGGTETILFVEDEELLIQMVSLLLESKGYNVLCAHDGLEAVNIYQSHKQDIALVLTDMGLPVMTGTDEFKKLKEINPNVKVIFASGFFEPDVKSELLKDGAIGFIQKPYEPSDILRIIRQALDQKA